MPAKTGAIDDESTLSASEIAAALEEEIALAYLRPRERLVEEELALRFNAKRHVIRQALSELDAMGIVTRLPNRGAAVKDFSALDVKQLWLVRTLVEGCAVKLIPLPAPAGLVSALTAIHERHSKAIEKGDLRRVFRENLKFHEVLYEACGNAVLAEMIQSLAFKAHAIRSYSMLDPELRTAARDEHAQIIELLQKRDRKRLVELVGSHIQPAMNAYLRLTGHMPVRVAPRKPLPKVAVKNLRPT